MTRLELRRRCVFADIAPDALALEIGPAQNAILPSVTATWIKTVDYLYG